MQTKSVTTEIQGTPEHIASKIVCDFYERLQEIHKHIKCVDLDFMEPGANSDLPFVDVIATYLNPRDSNNRGQIQEAEIQEAEIQKAEKNMVLQFARAQNEDVIKFLTVDLGAKKDKSSTNRYHATEDVYKKAKQQLQSVCPQKPTPAASQEGEVIWIDGDRYPTIEQ